jgi:hypothetical protein
MSHNKKKFDLAHLVSKGLLTEGESIFFVSDPAKSAVIRRQPNHEYKIEDNGTVTTVHAFVQRVLGQEPPDHASKWLRTAGNKILFDLWKQSLDDSADA